MENVLRIEKILDFCDVPQLFVARDAFDTLYLCLLYEDELLCRYTGIRISARRLEQCLVRFSEIPIKRPVCGIGERLSEHFFKCHDLPGQDHVSGGELQ